MVKKTWCSKCKKEVEEKEVIKHDDHDDIVLACGHSRKHITRSLMENVQISERLRININRTLDEASRELHDDKEALDLLKRINKEKEINKDIIAREYGTSFDKLIKYGLVDVFLDNTVSVSGSGLQLLRKNLVL
jgi:hypothetical protein